MVRSVQHEMLAKPDHDEAARQAFVLSLKRTLNQNFRSRHREVFEHAAVPAWEREHGHAPATRDEIRRAMQAQPVYVHWSALNRSAQELMWAAIETTVHRERARLEKAAQRLACSPLRCGSLELDTTFVPPRAMRSIDIHLQPGGYALDEGPSDIVAGALYESGGNLYAFGQGIGRKDSKAHHVQRFIRGRWPHFTPRNILDMGCSAGSASVAYAQAFSAAEVHAIDVGAGMLRYAHARAESLGAAVHFHQRDCADTHFAADSFDLIVSHNLMHEISDVTRRAMLRETWRLLRPGGVFVHQDVPLRFDSLTEFEKFERSWDTLNNNEPYWEVYANANLHTDLADAGIPADGTYVGSLPATPGSLPWFVVAGAKS